MVYIRPNKNYPLNWNKLRFRIFERDRYRCYICGRYCRGNSHCHHIIPVKMGGSHHEDNLMTLCSECHEDLHLGLLKIDKNELRRLART